MERVSKRKPPKPEGGGRCPHVPPRAASFHPRMMRETPLARGATSSVSPAADSQLSHRPNQQNSVSRCNHRDALDVIGCANGVIITIIRLLISKYFSYNPMNL